MFNPLTASIDAMATGVILADTGHKVLTINQSAMKLLGLTQTPVKLEQIVAKLPKRLEFLVHVKYCSLEHKSCNFLEVELDSRTVGITLAPLFDGSSLRGNLITMQDITDSIGKEHTRDQFLSMLVHELRTPITAIRGNAALISEMYKEVLKDPTLQEIVTDIESGSRTLLEMVNQFLDMSRLEEGRIHYDLKEFDAIEVATHTTQELAVLASQKGLTLAMAGEHDASSARLVVGDPGRTRQVLTNLIGNAIKFTETGGVTVEARVSEGTIDLYVHDTGPGIPADSRGGLFKKYFQASNNQFRHDSTKSTGLGLYVTKLMVEGMRGTIEFVDTPGVAGSTFCLRLPLATPENHRLMDKAIAEDRQGVKHTPAIEHSLVA